MKSFDYLRIYGLVILWFFAPVLYAQQGFPAIEAGPDKQIACGDSCITLNASAFQTGSTDTYMVSRITYNPFPYDSGTAFTVAADDQWSPVLNLPFTFCYFGIAYTQVVISSNGELSFNIANAGLNSSWSIPGPMPSATPADIKNTIFAPWQDIDLTHMGSIHYLVLGTAPSRIFVASWYKCPYYGDPNSANTSYCSIPRFATSQVVLYETTNTIEINIQAKDIICDNLTGVFWDSAHAVEGIQNATGTIAYTVTGRNAARFALRNDSWRFTPAGPSIVSVSWWDGATQISTDSIVTVCPTQAAKTYIAQAVYTPCAGGTVVTVTDSVTVRNPGRFTFTKDSTNVNCFGGSDGSATIHVTSGTPPFQFNWNGAGNTSNPTDTGLAVGVVNVIASDSNCSVPVMFNITQPTQLAIFQVNQNNVSCSGARDGNVTVNASGGVPGYTYNWSNNLAGPEDSLLPAGVYIVTVTDGHACTLTQSDTITQPAPATLTIHETDAVCFGPHGSAQAIPSAGTAPYSFLWSDGQTTQTADTLAGGTYTCTVSDARGCQATASTTINQPLDLQLSYTGTGVKCIGDKNGTITPSASGGVPPYDFSASQDGANFAFTTNGVIIGLDTGTYTVYLSDSNGCTKTISAYVPNATPNVFITYTDSTLCYGPAYNDGAAHIIDSSSQNAPYQYSIDGGALQDTGYFGNLAAGPHMITTVNVNGCKDSVPVVVYEPLPIVVEVVPDTVILPLGQSQGVMVNYLNATNPSYNWVGFTGLSCMDCPNPVVSAYTPGDYSVTVSMVNGTATCYGSAMLNVQVLPHKPVFIPNSFSPNGDGNNDVFLIYGEDIKVVNLKIFNRWGILVFQSENQFGGWDGTYKSVIQEPAVFVYVADITFLDNTTQKKTGSITIVR